jgi:hypothetical protein
VRPLSAAAGATVGEALRAFRAANGLDQDEHLAPVWVVTAGCVSIWLPHFDWRRRAIDAHDIHHLITGYPCTIAGELRIAAWEFGAGRYPHWGATLFCLPLVIAGLICMPRAIIAAFRRGRASRSLYDGETLARLTALPLAEARAIMSGNC